jgi:hypothetical protein
MHTVASRPKILQIAQNRPNKIMIVREIFGGRTPADFVQKRQKNIV